eukprot:TRINITY_DN8338_c2_g1_i1.p1 TRINITY_DN8338_c2_g1~~TRINITY_DN8338_c2_g1_i1.p1  ORF type:complete len:438 (+),score=63.20 TRINITY_DN8338_c2_g1_i1:117-1430(+)
MDPAMLLLLSSFMQLQDTFPLDSLSPSLLDTNAPLLFFMLAASLSHAASLFSNSVSDNEQDEEEEDDEEEEEEEEKLPNQDLQIDNLNSSDIALIPDPHLRNNQWRTAYGLSYSLFVLLLEELRPHIPANAIPSMPLQSALAMVLSRLSQGRSSRAISKTLNNFSPWEVSRITNLITRTIATKLYNRYIKIPSGSALQQIMNGFRNMTGLPNMCGAINGSHVKLAKRPSQQEELYMSRYGFYSVLLQAVSDHRRVFWDVCVRAPGASDNVTHLRESSIFGKLLSGQVLRESLISLKGATVRPYIVGDLSYPLLSFLMTPFLSESPTEAMFDGALMKGRMFGEQALWLLKERWKVLQNLNVGTQHAPQTIVACCVLHNLCQLYGEPELSHMPLWLDSRENGPPPRATDAEKDSHCMGEHMRRILLEDLQDRCHRAGIS